MKKDLKKIAIHVWHLEMTDNPGSSGSGEVSREEKYDLRQSHVPLPELNRFLYAAVGAPWTWYMRLQWSWQEWFDFLAKDSVQTWVAYIDATPIGYFELEAQANGAVEIAYFGLLPEFVGKGYGGGLLEDAIDKAWQMASARIWLHTCTLDHPNALPNYLRRGFRVFKEEDFEDEVPTRPLQPWDGAGKPVQA